MPFEILRGEITAMKTDAIVNTANPKPLIGFGVDSAIHRKAGPELLKARKKIGRLAPGQAAATEGFGLDARYVIHTVGPVWQGGNCGEADALRSCYTASLNLALELGCESVSFPLISSGSYGFPKAEALQIAADTITAFLEDHDMDIRLVVFDRDSFQISEALFQSVSSFIDECSVREYSMQEYGSPTPTPYAARRESESYFSAAQAPASPRPRKATKKKKPPLVPPKPQSVDGETELDFCFECAPMDAFPPQADPFSAAAPSLSLEDMLRSTDRGFSDRLMELIDRSGQSDAQIYKKANVDRRLFSKIRSNPAYQPSKPTAVAFAIALELDLPQARDLIGRAGYALSRSSKFDIIIEYFITRRIYNITDINLTLFQFDQVLLGNQNVT